MRLFLGAIVVFLFAAFPFADAQAACSDADVSQQLSDTLVNINASPDGVAVAKQVEIAASKGLIKPGKKEAMLSYALEYLIRKSSKCPIPEALTAKVSNALAIGKSDGERCEVGQFSTAVDRQFKTLKSSGGYEVFEGMIKQQVSANIVSSAKDVFIARWEGDSGFRESVIKAGLEMGAMHTSNCANPQDPILKIIEEF